MKTAGYYKAGDIQEILDCGRTKAYSVLKELNFNRRMNNLPVIDGAVEVDYFYNCFPELERK